MAVNQSIYGAKAEWIPMRTGSKVKLANFGSGNTEIQYGFTLGKLQKDKGFNTSIVHSALGNESALSRLQIVKNNDIFAEDNNDETLWSFACGGTPVANVDQDILSDTTVYMLTPKTNSTILNSSTQPIVDFSYKDLRAWIRVSARKNKTNYTDTITKNLDDYCANFSSSHPYISSVSLVLYERVSGVWTPLDIRGLKGILIHNNSVYTTALRSPGKTYRAGKIGGLMCTNYGSSADIAYFNILGAINANLASFDIHKDYINIISGDCDIEKTSDRCYVYKEYYAGIREYIMHQTACFGIQFVTDPQYIDIDLESEETTEAEAENVYIGVLDDNYVGHGDFINGKAILNNKQYELDSADDTEYVPTLEEDGDFGDFESDTHNIGELVGSRTYLVTPSNLTALLSEISTSAGESGQNYIDYISSIVYSPWGFQDLPAYNVPIRIFGHEFNTTGRKSSRVYTVESNEYYIDRYFNDFRDYAPYTKITAKIPYADSVELDASEWYGCAFSVTYSIDLSSGIGLATIYRRNSIGKNAFMTLGCSPAVPISVSAIMSGSYLNALHANKAQLNGALATSILAATTAATMKNPVGAAGGLVGGFISANEKAYQMQHMQKPTKRVGSSGSIADMYFSNRINLIFERLARQKSNFNDKIYSNTVGHACFKTGTLGSFTGLTVCSDVDLADCAATAEEKQLIINALKQGVYL